MGTVTGHFYRLQKEGGYQFDPYVCNISRTAQFSYMLVYISVWTNVPNFKSVCMYVCMYVFMFVFAYLRNYKSDLSNSFFVVLGIVQLREYCKFHQNRFSSFWDREFFAYLDCSWLSRVWLNRFWCGFRRSVCYILGKVLIYNNNRYLVTLPA